MAQAATGTFHDYLHILYAIAPGIGNVSVDHPFRTTETYCRSHPGSRKLNLVIVIRFQHTLTTISFCSKEVLQHFTRFYFGIFKGSLLAIYCTNEHRQISGPQWSAKNPVSANGLRLASYGPVEYYPVFEVASGCYQGTRFNYLRKVCIDGNTDHLIFIIHAIGCTIIGHFYGVEVGHAVGYIQIVIAGSIGGHLNVNQPSTGLKLPGDDVLRFRIGVVVPGKAHPFAGPVRKAADLYFGGGFQCLWSHTGGRRAVCFQGNTACITGTYLVFNGGIVQSQLNIIYIGFYPTFYLG